MDFLKFLQTLRRRNSFAMLHPFMLDVLLDWELKEQHRMVSFFEGKIMPVQYLLRNELIDLGVHR